MVQDHLHCTLRVRSDFFVQLSWGSYNRSSMETLSSVMDWPTQQSITTAASIALIGWVSLSIYQVVRNLYFHPLSKFPGPKAAAATILWKAYVECIQNKSFCHVLEGLHVKYGVPCIIFILARRKVTFVTAIPELTSDKAMLSVSGLTR